MSTYNRVVAADEAASLAPTVRARLATEMADPTSDVGASLSDAIMAGVNDLTWMSPIGDQWDGSMQAGIVAAERSRFTRLLRSAGDGLAIGRRGTTYDLYQEVEAGIWWRQSLAYDSTTNGEHHSMMDSVIGAPMLSLDESHSSFTYSALGWGTSSNVNTFGGTYAKNSTTGETVTWTTPTATKVGLRAFRTTNGGYAKATINGSATLAALLPTAQDEVTAGRLASVALVANGGTLNATDRLFNSYGSTSDSDIMVPFAEGLSSAVHSVVLTVTGYKQGTSTDVRLYISGGIYSTDATTLTTSGAKFAPYVVILSGSSVSEYAIVYKREGGTLAPFIGNRHGNEVEDTFTFTIDGATVTPADGSITLCSTSAIITRTARLLNPDNASETVANSVCEWAMLKSAALNVHWTIDWVQPGTAGTAYPAMLPTQGNNFAKGRVAAGSVQTLLSDDGSVKGSTRSDTIALWQDGGHGAVMATVRNLPTAVNRWENATDFAWLQDRSGGDFNKGYFQRVQGGASEPIVAGDRWEAFISYRAAWVSSTASLAS